MVGAHRPPAQAVQRGRQALGAGRRPGRCRWSRWSGRCALLTEHGGGTAERGDPRHRPRPAAVPRSACRRTCRPGGSASTTRRRGWSRCWSGSAARCAGRDRLPRTRARSAWPRRRDGASVTPPTWRPDLTDPADLVEEVVRLDGYDKVPQRAADRAARPRPDPARSGAAGRSAGRWPSAGTSRCSSLPVRRRRSWPTRSACRPTTRAGARCGWPTRCPTRSRCCARRCWPAARHAASATSAGATATWRSTRSALVFHPRAGAGSAAGDGRGPAAHRRGVRRRRRGACRPAVARRGGAGRRARPGRLVGRRAGRPAGRTRSRRPGRCWPPPGSPTSGSRCAAAEYAPWHPGRCAELAGRRRRSSGTPASCTRRCVAALELPRRTSAMELNLDALPPPR